ncbi:MAG: hypothetical protein ACYC9O_19015 [Candidatus Latescibacterota bacterium]
MRTFKLLSALALSMFLVMSCGGDDDNNPVNGGGNTNTGGSAASKGSLTQHSGANAAVTESNVQQVSTTVTSKSFEVFGRALSTVKYSKTAKPVAGTIMTLDGKVDGFKSGNAQVKGTMTMTQAGTSVSGYTYNFTCTYNDFSDDSQLWMGGELAYTGTYDMTNTSSMKYDITINGGLKFNGLYEGIQDFTTKYTMAGQAVSWTSTITTTSGGKSFTSKTIYPL